MKNWEDITANVEKLLTDSLIVYKFDGHGEFRIAATDERPNVTVEVTGTPWKPEFWVGEMRCKLSEILECIRDCEYVES